MAEWYSGIVTHYFDRIGQLVYNNHVIASYLKGDGWYAYMWRTTIWQTTIRGQMSPYRVFKIMPLWNVVSPWPLNWFTYINMSDITSCSVLLGSIIELIKFGVNNIGHTTFNHSCMFLYGLGIYGTFFTNYPLTELWPT